MDKTNERNLRKRMKIAVIAAVCLIPILIGVTFLVGYIENKKAAEDIVIDYNWYEADFDENIYENEEYLKKLSEYDSFISFTEGSVTLPVDKDNAKSYGEEVDFMVRYLYSIIEGDSDKYNSFFSDTYYKKHDPKEPFTMQMIYEVSLTKELLSKTDDQKDDYKSYSFILSYRILKNNGTFRKDIGDGYRRQYITVTNRDGELLIDNIATEKIIVK